MGVIPHTIKGDSLHHHNFFYSNRIVSTLYKMYLSISIPYFYKTIIQKNNLPWFYSACPML